MEKETIKTPETTQEYIDELIKVYPKESELPENIDTKWKAFSDLKAGKDPESLKEMIKQTIQGMDRNVSIEEKKEIAKLLFKVLQNGDLPKDAMGITPERMAEIYSYAFTLFGAGNYKDSLELFKFLNTVEPNNSDFATSAGTCFHRLQDYEGAIVYYMLSVGINQADPLPTFYAYDCFLKLGCKPLALIMLEYTILKAKDLPKYAHIKEKASLLAEELEREIIDKKVH